MRHFQLSLKEVAHFSYLQCWRLVVPEIFVLNMTIFVIRNGLLNKELLPEVENYYKEKKLRNMALVLNGSEVATGRYGYHRHGYGYGYGYGKGYGSYTKEED